MPSSFLGQSHKVTGSGDSVNDAVFTISPPETPGSIGIQDLPDEQKLMNPPGPGPGLYVSFELFT